MRPELERQKPTASSTRTLAQAVLAEGTTSVSPYQIDPLPPARLTMSWSSLRAALPQQGQTATQIDPTDGRVVKKMRI